MSVDLPTAKELERLPLRALVAYATRSLKRLRPELRGAVDDHIVDRLIADADAVCTDPLIGHLNNAEITRTAAQLVEAMTAIDSRQKMMIALAFTRLATAAEMVIETVKYPTTARRCITRAADAVQKAVHVVELLADSERVKMSGAIRAARRDYEVLLEAYGEHDTVLIGDPVTCFGEDEGGRRSNEN
jgi:hypothetical protein